MLLLKRFHFPFPYLTPGYNSSEKEAQEVAAQINKETICGKAIVIQCDVSKEDEVQAMFKQTIEKFGTVDILVANSGLQKDAPLHEMKLKDWQLVIDVNLTGQFLCAREALREFMRRGIREGVSKSLGKIIHMSSVHQIIPWAGHTNYAASKGALVMLMESICQEYAPLKVRCNSIAPGAIKTDINRDAWETQEALNKLNELIKLSMKNYMLMPLMIYDVIMDLLEKDYYDIYDRNIIKARLMELKPYINHVPQLEI